MYLAKKVIDSSENGFKLKDEGRHEVELREMRLMTTLNNERKCHMQVFSLSRKVPYELWQISHQRIL